MSLSGTLRSWNDERGFGFIAPTNGGREVFVHISAFPRDGSRPTIGEKLTFELVQAPDGKNRATRVVRLAVGDSGAVARPVAAANTRPAVWVRTRPAASSSRPRFGRGRSAAFMLLIISCAYAYDRVFESEKRSAVAAVPSVASSIRHVAPPSPSFRCDGRTYCGEMTSCTEAKWFINNCPGTKMDGDGDGVPCEEQWCTSPLAR